MKKFAILAALVMVAAATVPASASVQTIKISGAIDNHYIYRSNFDFGAHTSSDDFHSVGLTQTQLHVDADLTDNVSATVGLINERVWGDADGTNDGVSLYLAYVTLREMLYSPLTVVAGRQSFAYGNSFIVDSAGINNVAPSSSGISSVAADFTKQTTLDAVRAIFDYNPLTLEFVYASLDSNKVTLSTNNDNIDLYGVNSTYELGDEMGTEVEAYFFARIDRDYNADDNTTSLASKSDTLYVPGLRASTSPYEGLNVQGEFAWQRGNKVITTSQTNGNAEREAFAVQLISTYSLPVLEEYNPMLQYVFTHVSGDSNPTDVQDGSNAPASGTKWTGWDPLLENQGAGQIWNSLFNLTNANIHHVKVSANPMEDVTASFLWTGIWLDKDINCASSGLSTCSTQLLLVQPDGDTTTLPVVNNDSNELGYEIDAMVTYDYTEDVQFGASLGWFVPGDVFASANEQTAFQALFNGNVNF
ncbi:MAG: alginate export family protein [Candidatus Omnitrophica bacterium]|nr:alginate export family protein [Candidatus Omnitrophota bacterium]